MGRPWGRQQIAHRPWWVCCGYVIGMVGYCRKVSEEEARKRADELQVKYQETSALTGDHAQDLLGMIIDLVEPGPGESGRQGEAVHEIEGGE